MAKKIKIKMTQTALVDGEWRSAGDVIEVKGSVARFHVVQGRATFDIGDEAAAEKNPEAIKKVKKG